MAPAVRAFVAVDAACPAPLREIVSQLGNMGRAVKPVDAQHMHVTLKFLGDTDPEAVPRIADVVRGVASSEAAFALRIVGLGAFPHAARPNVVWAGLPEFEPLRRLAEGLESELGELGFAPETRAFRPHLTLARIKARPPGELAEVLAQHAATEFGAVTVDAVHLYRSELGPQGPAYTRLATQALRT